MSIVTKGLRSSTLKVVTDAMNKLYPLKYADNSWDNTGLLVDSSIPDVENNNVGTKEANILLTIDLTEAVAQEAIDKKCNVIIAYHPFLFRKFNRISPTDNSQHRTLMKLIRNNISIYSPHTSVDAANGGVNDWLVEGISAGSKILKTEVIIPDKSGIEGVGMGRTVQFENSITLTEFIKRAKNSLNLQYIQCATRNKLFDEVKIKKIALCAGSGISVFNSYKNDDIDLYYTGEMSHHEMLSIVESHGKTVILGGHCNTERGFLANKMCAALKETIGAEIDKNDGKTNLEKFAVFVSECDCSPFITV